MELLATHAFINFRLSADYMPVVTSISRYRIGLLYFTWCNSQNFSLSLLLLLSRRYSAY